MFLSTVFSLQMPLQQFQMIFLSRFIQQELMSFQTIPAHSIHQEMIDSALLQTILSLILLPDSVVSKIDCLGLKYGEMRSRTLLSSIYPFNYYRNLLKNLMQLVTITAIPAQTFIGSSKFLLRLALYMNLKRIPIKRYARCLLADNNLRQQLESVPIYRFGPVGCRITNFYCLLSVGSAVEQFRDALALKLSSFGQHFKTITRQVVVGSEQFMDLVYSEEEDVLSFFLERCPLKQEWGCFINNVKRDDTFYQLIVIEQPKKSCYNINQKLFPCSLETIANAYLEAYLPVRHQRKLKDKTDKLQKVTEQLLAIKDIILPPCKHIQVVLHSQKEEALIQNGVRTILAVQNAVENTYYLLISRMEKHRIESKPWQINVSLAGILTQVNPTLPTF